jgi:hypothetical protein
MTRLLGNKAHSISSASVDQSERNFRKAIGVYWCKASDNRLRSIGAVNARCIWSIDIPKSYVRFHGIST